MRSASYWVARSFRAWAAIACAVSLGVSWASSPRALAASVIYSATDLADTTPGQDLWEYSYQVSDLTLTANQGFTIFFDLSLYTLLQDPPPFVNADFDLLVVQPDLALSSNGFYDAQALRDNPSLADPFTERFVWLGTGTPGAQPFAIYNTDFSTREQGQTAVPEPAVTALFFTALPAFARRKRKRP